MKARIMEKAPTLRGIQGYEGLYEVSDTGRVFSLKFGKRRKIAAGLSSSGYLSVVLQNSAKRRSLTVHRLVAFAFLENPEMKATVNHKDGVKTNNHVSNLEWNTQSENMRHAYRVLKIRPARLGKLGKLHAQSKRVEQYDKNGKFVKLHVGIREAARQTNLSRGSVSNVITGRTKTGGGFVWKYATEEKGKIK